MTEEKPTILKKEKPENNIKNNAEKKQLNSDIEHLREELESLVDTLHEDVVSKRERHNASLADLEKRATTLYGEDREIFIDRVSELREIFDRAVERLQADTQDIGAEQKEEISFVPWKKISSEQKKEWMDIMYAPSGMVEQTVSELYIVTKGNIGIARELVAIPGIGPGRDAVELYTETGNIKIARQWIEQFPGNEGWNVAQLYKATQGNIDKAKALMDIPRIGVGFEASRLYLSTKRNIETVQQWMEIPKFQDGQDAARLYDEVEGNFVEAQKWLALPHINSGLLAAQIHFAVGGDIDIATRLMKLSGLEKKIDSVKYAVELYQEHGGDMAKVKKALNSEEEQLSAETTLELEPETEQNNDKRSIDFEKNIGQFDYTGGVFRFVDGEELDMNIEDFPKPYLTVNGMDIVFWYGAHRYIKIQLPASKDAKAVVDCRFDTGKSRGGNFECSLNGLKSLLKESLKLMKDGFIKTEEVESKLESRVSKVAHFVVMPALASISFVTNLTGFLARKVSGGRLDWGISNKDDKLNSGDTDETGENEENIPEPRPRLPLLPPLAPESEPEIEISRSTPEKPFVPWDKLTPEQQQLWLNIPNLGDKKSAIELYKVTQGNYEEVVNWMQIENIGDGWDVLALYKITEGEIEIAKRWLQIRDIGRGLDVVDLWKVTNGELFVAKRWMELKRVKSGFEATELYKEYNGDIDSAIRKIGFKTPVKPVGRVSSAPTIDADFDLPDLREDNLSPDSPDEPEPISVSSTPEPPARTKRSFHKTKKLLSGATKLAAVTALAMGVRGDNDTKEKKVRPKEPPTLVQFEEAESPVDDDVDEELTRRSDDDVPVVQKDDENKTKPVESKTVVVESKKIEKKKKIVQKEIKDRPSTKSKDRRFDEVESNVDFDRKVVKKSNTEKVVIGGGVKPAELTPEQQQMADYLKETGSKAYGRTEVTDKTGTHVTEERVGADVGKSGETIPATETITTADSAWSEMTPTARYELAMDDVQARWDAEVDKMEVSGEVTSDQIKAELENYLHQKESAQVGFSDEAVDKTQMVDILSDKLDDGLSPVLKFVLEENPQPGEVAVFIPKGEEASGLLKFTSYQGDVYFLQDNEQLFKIGTGGELFMENEDGEFVSAICGFDSDKLVVTPVEDLQVGN